MKINANALKNAFERLAHVAGLPTSKGQAIKEGKELFLFMENAPIYGGYRLVMVGVKNGAHYGAFGENGIEPRLKKAGMYTKIHALIQGMEYAKRLAA